MQSHAENPHAWMMMDVDVSNLIGLRDKLKISFLRREGVPLSLSSFVLKPVVNALKEFPLLNSTWDSGTGAGTGSCSDSGNIHVRKHINPSIVVVGTEDSVVTPVIHNADRKSIAGLAIELCGLVERARSGAMLPSDLHGGTFTFHNAGSNGSVQSSPIIPQSQAVIITFESIVRKPVIIQEMIAIRSIVNLCISYDHRMVDALMCGRFMQQVKHELEKYDPDTVIY